MAQKIKPLSDRIVIKRTQAETSKGGILLPGASKDKPLRGKVVSVGPGKYDEHGQLVPMEVKIEDEVLFGAYAGTPILNEEDLLILNQDEVLAVVN